MIETSLKETHWYAFQGCDSDDDCPRREYCDLNTHQCSVIEGRVLLGSVTIKTKECDGCSPQNEGVVINLKGEKTATHKDGYPCRSSETIPLNHKSRTDFDANGSAKFSDINDKNMLGQCSMVYQSGHVAAIYTQLNFSHFRLPWTMWCLEGRWLGLVPENGFPSHCVWTGKVLIILPKPVS